VPQNPLPELILASTSRYRRELLDRLGLAFTCIAPGIDEQPAPNERAVALVSRLAREKALAVARRYSDAWVIGSDQVAVLPDTEPELIIGKPGTVARCHSQLLAASGRTLKFLTAITLTRQRDPQVFEFLDITQVNFRSLDEASIQRYVQQESPLDCAGGFKSEGLGITLCESIISEDPWALIGLPLIKLSSLLRQVGYSLP